MLKILMFITDFATYKTYLDLKNFLINNNCNNIELNYYYFNFQFTHSYPINVNNMVAHNHITKYLEKDYTNQQYGFAITHTLFLESFISILRNYINNQEDLLDIDKNNIFLNHIEWYDEFYNQKMNHDIFNKEINNIPYADLYLISDRTDIPSTGALSVELTLALYLIRTYNSKVFIGGGVFNESKNIIVQLINAVGKEYTNGKLEYLVGTIGVNIFNYIKGYDYQNKRTPIENIVNDIYLTHEEMSDIMCNRFAIELVRGCTQKCQYCCNHTINQYSRVNIDIYKQWLFYLSENYPNCLIHFFAPEVNTNKQYFIDVLNYIINNNIKNPFSFYINLSKIDDEQIEMLSKINLVEIKTSIDNLFDKQNNKIWYNLDIVDNNITKLRNILRSKHGRLQLYIVANAPTYHIVDWNTYKYIFKKYYDIISYSEFYIYPSTVYFNNPADYGITYLYYSNRYKETSAISNIISKVPVMFFRKDRNRKDIVNMKYEILKNMKSEIILELSGAVNNIRSLNFTFLLALMNQIYPDLDLIETHDKQLDKYIISYSNNVGYRFYPKNNTIQKMQRSLRC